MEISVVIPVFNEEENIPVLYKRLKKVLNGISLKHEIIFVNDGSRDNSLNEIKNLRKGDRKVKYLSFSRNFGHMASVSAGLKSTRGRCVCVMDADLQDPPRVITRMYKRLKKGNEVVYGVKKERKEGRIKRFLFSMFYSLLNVVAQVEMPLGAGTFCLMDRKVVDVINDLPERNKYFSGMRAWAGFRQEGVSYKRAARYAGKSVSYKKLFKLAMDGFISFSHIPLRIASIFGFIFAGGAFVSILVVMYLRLFVGISILGWASTISVILLIGGVQLITLGIIGEYLARIYDEVKGRPEYVVGERSGL